MIITLDSLVNLGMISTPAGLFMCHKCDVGSYASRSGQESCEECPAGQYNSQPGLMYCLQCQPGTFNNDTGADSCDSCPKGIHFHNNADTSNKTKQSVAIMKLFFYLKTSSSPLRQLCFFNGSDCV